MRKHRACKLAKVKGESVIIRTKLTDSNFFFRKFTSQENKKSQI